MAKSKFGFGLFHLRAHNLRSAVRNWCSDSVYWGWCPAILVYQAFFLAIPSFASGILAAVSGVTSSIAASQLMGWGGSTLPGRWAAPFVGAFKMLLCMRFRSWAPLKCSYACVFKSFSERIIYFCHFFFFEDVEKKWD